MVHLAVRAPTKSNPVVGAEYHPKPITQSTYLPISIPSSSAPAPVAPTSQNFKISNISISRHQGQSRHGWNKSINLKRLFDMLYIPLPIIPSVHDETKKTTASRLGDEKRNALQSSNFYQNKLTSNQAGEENQESTGRNDTWIRDPTSNLSIRAIYKVHGKGNNAVKTDPTHTRTEYAPVHTSIDQHSRLTQSKRMIIYSVSHQPAVLAGAEGIAVSSQIRSREPATKWFARVETELERFLVSRRAPLQLSALVHL